MQVTQTNSDPVNATLTVTIERADYQAKVDKALKSYQQKVLVPGFRKGMAPLGRIKAMYGKALLAEEVNTLLSKGLNDYVNDNHLPLIGDPLPAKEKLPTLDLDKQDDYSFSFDIGLAPEINVRLTKKDKLPYYTLQVPDEMLEPHINNYKAHCGTYVEVDEVQDKDMVKGTLTELDGLVVENAVLMPSFIKDAAEKAKFDGAKKGDTIAFNPYKAFEGHEAELASLLKIAKEEVKNHTGEVTIKIEGITRYTEGELNQELFDKICEPGTVTSEAQLRDKIRETLAVQFVPESDYRFLLDAQKALEEKAADVQFPDEFLKRRLIESNPDRTPEAIDTDYAQIRSNLIFQLIKSEIIKENKVEITDEEVVNAAQNATRAQFAQYGMSNVPDSMLENYVQEMLKKQETVRGLADKVYEGRLINILKEQATLQPQDISMEDFKKLYT
ncbi:cell division trigger factor [Candidatus Symbiothrix dinenymphae]|nr:cell division trigger factor [Candidatus Symbiothrix dinenymphae]